LQAPATLHVPVPPALQSLSFLHAQLPVEQARVPAQAWPHAPQFCGSLLSALQPPDSQHVLPLPQLGPLLQLQTELEPFARQASPALQVVPPHVQMPVDVLQRTLFAPPRLHAMFVEHPQMFLGWFPPQTKCELGLP
jgi:hypothetical protein